MRRSRRRRRRRRPIIWDGGAESSPGA
ncbi:hypothetical protein EYF80_051503 [Liparis tanakae]|uniref:Uncharacterized protein n=1 Tax=Liparis tanakae TaxID=230148 RepID=A0A4Z2FAT2_9TELE|nr:hypothetical protein EYF80_051503 [Liparis tanakae]